MCQYVKVDDLYVGNCSFYEAVRIFFHWCWQYSAGVPHRGSELNRIMVLISVSTKLLFWVDDNGLGRVRNDTKIRSEGEIPDLEHFPTYKFWPLPYFSFDLIDT